MWLSMQLVLLQCSIRCHGFGLTLNPPPPPVHFSPLSRDDTIVSQISPFQSSARTWLKNEATPTQWDSTGRQSPSLLVSISSSSRLLATTADELTMASDSPEWTNQILHSKLYKTEKVKRVIDASTIQLEKGGYISLESVRGAGSTYQLPDCMTYAPSYKLKQLLPKGTMVRYINLGDAMNNNDAVAKSSKSSSTTPRVWIVRDKDEMLINQELVRTGFAFVRKGAKAPTDMMDDLIRMEQTAKEQGLGIYNTCSAIEGGTTTFDNNDNSSIQTTSNFVAEFEPLDYTTETRYGDDGGKLVIVSRQDLEASSTPPPNPGDVKACFDFRTYEESLRWYETYAPYYGDVAKLDRDGDGVPCPGLPHTTVGEKYRMKRSTNNVLNSK